MTFFIDDQEVGTYVQMATRVANYTSNALVYGNDSIPYGMHTFVLQNGHPNVQSGETLVLLDYLIYSCVSVGRT